MKIDELFEKLYPVMGNKLDVLWAEYWMEDWKGKKEIEDMLNLLYAAKIKKNISSDYILLPPPDKEAVKGKFPLGTVSYNNKDLYKLNLKEKDFLYQINIVGSTGSGKTNAAYILALELLKNNTPFLAIDWKRGWRNLLSLKNPEVEQLQIFTIGRETLPFHWNPLKAPPNVSQDTWLQIVAETLEKSHIAGQGVADVFLRIYKKLFRESDKLPNFFDGKKELDNIDARARALLWKQSAERVFNSLTYGSAKYFNSRTPMDLAFILERPTVFELDQELPKPMRVFFQEILLRWIHLYRLSQGETDKLKHVLFLEEIHNLFPKTRIEREASNSLETIFREIRGLGEGIVSIDQHSSLLPLFILGNSHTQIVFGLQHSDDIYESKKSLFLQEGQEHYLDKLEPGQSIVKIKNRINPCLVKLPLIPIKKGIITDALLNQEIPKNAG